MTCAIIGTGNFGTALARLFSRAGIEVSIANTRGPETIQPIVKQRGGGLRLRLQPALRVAGVRLTTIERNRHPLVRHARALVPGIHVFTDSQQERR
jgi:8-hydroxy-5-deazaflavin:NADPH oxidoreductase